MNDLIAGSTLSLVVEQLANKHFKLPSIWEIIFKQIVLKFCRLDSTHTQTQHTRNLILYVLA